MTQPQSLTPNPQSLCRSRRPGISLLEVLISMGVLAVGIMGVAALIPAGRFEILQGSKMDHASMIGRAAFREMKIRGYLNPANWLLTDKITEFAPGLGTPTTTPFNGGIPQDETDIGVVFDPIGLTSAPAPDGPLGRTFPHGTAVTYAALKLWRIYPSAAVTSKATADAVFRNGNDLLFNASTTKNAPPEQQVMKDASSNPIKRASQGDYSWIATIYNEPSNLGTGSVANGLVGKVVVSVAVFYKRNPLLDTSVTPTKAFNETEGDVTFMRGGIGGGEVLVKLPPGKLAKPGQWVMLAGQRPNPTGPMTPTKWARYFRWYRVTSADVVDDVGHNPTTGAIDSAFAGTQGVSLTGPDWDATLNPTKVWTFDGLIAVYERNMMLELP